MGTWATDRLDQLLAGAEPPPVVARMELGTLDAWGDGWATKHWHAKPELLNSDGSMFGGYLAALGDQMAAFAAMTVVPADHLFRTTSLSTFFYKVGRGDVQVEARVTAQSRQMINVHVSFKTSDGVLLAECHAQQVLTPIARS